MKKFLATAGAALSSVLAFADPAVSEPILPQTNNGIEAFTQLKTDLTAWSGHFLPIILGILGVFMVYWLIKFGLRLVKSFASAGR